MGTPLGYALVRTLENDEAISGNEIEDAVTENAGPKTTWLSNVCTRRLSNQSEAVHCAMLQSQGGWIAWVPECGAGAAIAALQHDMAWRADMQELRCTRAGRRTVATRSRAASMAPQLR